MSNYESDIIHKLSARAAEPSKNFAKSLHFRLLEREQELKTNVIPTRRHIMNYKKLSVGLVGLILLAGVPAYIWILNNKEVELTTQTTQPDTTQASSLTSQQVQNLEAAKNALTFTPLLPSTQLNGEALKDIKVGTKGNMLDDSDTIYLTYADNQGTLYKMSQSTKKLNYPTDAEKITFQQNGNQISGMYYQLADVESGNSINSVGGEVTSPTSYIFWTLDKVTYEISEFGRVTKSQLIDLASSLK